MGWVDWFFMLQSLSILLSCPKLSLVLVLFRQGYRILQDDGWLLWDCSDAFLDRITGLTGCSLFLFFWWNLANSKLLIGLHFFIIT